MKSLFQHFPYANIQDRVPTYYVSLPYLGTMGLIPLDIGFWITTFTFLCGQALVNMVVALVVYEFLTPQRPNCWLIGYGLVIPSLLLAPIWIYSQWQAPNITLMLCVCGAVPNILTLRVMEAMHGTMPDYVTNRKMLLLYYSSTLQLMFQNGQPVPLTRQRFWAKLTHFLSVYFQTSLLYSVLLATGYHPFSNYLANAYAMASITSLVLDGGASGLGLLTSLVTGYTLENFSESPLTKSMSPSDFWGQRWDRPVQSALRRGCYQPLRKYFSSHVAAFGTFVVSGFIHEYVLYTMTFRSQHLYQPQYGNQFIFFLWNGIVLLLERFCPRVKLPRPIQTALVVMTVLPIAYLFTDEYMRSSFYDDASWAFPILVFLGETSRSNSNSSMTITG